MISSDQNTEQLATQPAIPTYLVWSILSTCLCCLPTGIYAIILSVKVDTLASMGKIDEAKQISAQAKKWIVISIVVGLIFSIIAYVFGFLLESHYFTM